MLVLVNLHSIFAARFLTHWRDTFFGISHSTFLALAPDNSMELANTIIAAALRPNYPLAGFAKSPRALSATKRRITRGHADNDAQFNIDVIPWRPWLLRCDCVNLTVASDGNQQGPTPIEH